MSFDWSPLSASSARESGQKVASHRLPIHLALVFPHGEVPLFDLLSATGEFENAGEAGHVR